jgi:Ca2+-dependent lipid-binding protein
MNPGLRSQAIKALQDWQISERILSGSDPEIIELRIRGAFSLPKSSFRIPTAWVNIVVYGPNKFGGAYRKFELKTDVAQKTQEPVWNQSFKLDIPYDARMIDLEVYDRVAGLTDKRLSMVRLKFSSIPGVEANLADRSLIYGINGM